MGNVQGRKGSRPSARTDEHWNLVRTSASRTLELTDLLLGDGLRAWSPRVWVRKRLPRKKVRRLTVIPILPTYVFVHQDDFSSYLKERNGRYWFSSPARFNAHFMTVPETEMAGLVEQDAPEKPRALEEGLDEDTIVLETFEVGERVKFYQDPFGEMEGEVIAALSGNDYRILLKNNFPGTMRIPHFLLERSTL